MAKAYTRRSKAKAALADRSVSSRVEFQLPKRAVVLRLVSEDLTEQDNGTARQRSMPTSRGGFISSKKTLGYTSVRSQRIGSVKGAHLISTESGVVAKGVFKKKPRDLVELRMRIREASEAVATSQNAQSDLLIAEIANSNLSLVERATRVGAIPGQVLGSAAVSRVMRRIASSAKDIFGTDAAAMEYLTQSTFSGRNISAQELLASGRATTVIARLDTLRYGSQG